MALSSFPSIPVSLARVCARANACDCVGVSVGVQEYMWPGGFVVGVRVGTQGVLPRFGSHWAASKRL